jgi:predicted dehydrogenase
MHKTVIIGAGVFDWPVQTHQCYLDINRHFKECVEEDSLPLASGEDGLRALMFLQAIMELNQTGRAIMVDL